MRRRFRTGASGAAMLALAVAAVAFAAFFSGGAWAADWPHERRSGRFVVRADFALNGFEPRFAELAGLERELTLALALPQPVGAPPFAPVDIYLFAGEAAYRRHLAQMLPNPPDRRALYVQFAGHGRVYAFRTQQLPADLRHECTHALLHASLPAAPLWLDEGLAEYFEAPAEQRAGESSRFAEMRRFAIRHNQVPSLARLEQLVAPDELTVDDYRDAWAWIHFLLHGPPGAKEELVHYLGELAANESPASLAASLQRRWPKLDESFLQHFRRNGPETGAGRLARRPS